VLNIPMSEKILNEPRVRSLIGQGKAASVTQHVRVGNEGLATLTVDGVHPNQQGYAVMAPLAEAAIMADQMK
jgi:lysophospholipase L1-like esterase